MISVPEMSLDGRELCVRYVSVAENVLAGDEVVFDVAAFQRACRPPQSFHVATSQAVLGPQFWPAQFLQQVQNYGLYVVRTNLPVGDTCNYYYYYYYYFDPR